jgi:predicted DNA-binding transcriptional regulator YafY
MNRKATAKELAKRFEVSVRTIYRDIEVLSSTDIPIYTARGKGGGINLIDGYTLDKSILSESEQTEILLALQSLSATQYPAIDKIIRKLSSLFKKEDLQWIDVDFSLWGADKNTNIFNLLKAAIVERRVICFEYYNSLGERSGRKVRPVKLVFKHNSWYLKAFCLLRNEWRTFKISRMYGIHKTEEFFSDIPAETLLKGVSKSLSATWVEVCMRIAPEGAYRVFDDFEKNEVKKNPDGSFTAISFFPEGEWLFNHILSYGVLGEVISPEHIRNGVLKRLKDNIKKYEIEKYE